MTFVAKSSYGSFHWTQNTITNVLALLRLRMIKASDRNSGAFTDAW